MDMIKFTGVFSMMSAVDIINIKWNTVALRMPSRNIAEL